VISRAEFERTLTLVRRSGAQDALQARLHPRGQGGRPRALDLDVLLAAMILTSTHSGSSASSTPTGRSSPSGRCAT